MHDTHRSRERGFTFAELMIVIAIIGILVAVLIPAVKRYNDRARAAQIAPTSSVEVIRVASQSGLKNAEVVGTHDYVDHVQDLGCWAKNDVAYVVEGTNGKEQRIRMTVCCRPGSSGSVCALPPRLPTPPMER